jgi:DNA polymerase-3 subunit gamma/tau
MPLQNDYRPQDLATIFGNESIVKSLEVVLHRENRPQTYLLCGPSGCGKTTLARIIAKELGCGTMDKLELNISNMRGIDTARTIIDNCRFQPLYGLNRVIILNEVHKSTNEFQNAMLEILEEPGPNNYFILCTTEPDKLLKTIKTRATTYQVSSLSRPEMTRLINWVLEYEGKILSERVINGILHAADGCPRQSLKLLDQIIDIDDETSQLQVLTTISTDEITVLDLCRAISSRESGATRWVKLSILLKGIEGEPESIRRAILGYLSNWLLKCKGDEGKKVALLMAEFSNNYYDSGKAGLITSCYLSTLI